MQIPRQLLKRCMMLVALWGILPVASAQELSPIEMVKQYPPGKGIFQNDGAEIAQQMLQWQIKRGEAQLQVLAKDIAKLRHQIEEIEKSADNEADEQPQELRYATDTVREELIGRCLQKLLDVRVDIAANKALLEELEKSLEAGKANKEEANAVAKSKQAQKQLLLEQIKILEHETARIEQLKKRGVVSKSEGQEARLKILTLRGELAKLEQVVAVRQNESAVQIASRVTDLHLETRRLQAFEEAARRQLEQLARAAKVAHDLKQHQREREQLERRLSLRVDRHEKVLADLEEAKVLLKQIQGVKDDDKSESPDAPEP